MEEIITNTVGMKLIPIRSGNFKLGEDRSECQDERPRHKVYLTKTFYMSATQVTNKQYEAFNPSHKALIGIIGKNTNNEECRIYGLYAAVSYDEGETWPVKRLIASGEKIDLDGGAWTGRFMMDETHGESMGYLAATQTPDNLIHLASSMQYYMFNLDWLEGK